MFRTALLSAALAVPLAAQDEAAFDAGYGKVRELLQKEKWQEARAAIDALLAANEKQLWVLAEKEAILEACRRCTFALETAVPKPQDLVSGKVLAWTPSTGRIRLRYGPETMQDWVREGERPTVFVHPAAWKGDYQITIHGSLSPRQGLAVLFDADHDARGIASFAGFPVGLKKGPTGHERDLLEERVVGLGEGRFTATLKVSAGHVQMSFGDAKVKPIDVRNPGQPGGQLGFSDLTFTDVQLEGTMEPSWFQNVTDGWLAARRADFDARYRPEQSLPAWLFEPPHSARTPAKYRSQVPGLEAAPRTATLQRSLAEVEKGQWQRLLTGLQQARVEDLPPLTRDYLQGLALHRLGQPEAALSHLDAALAGDPQFTWSRVLHAETLAELRRLGDAQAEYQQALLADPGEPALYQRTAVTMLMRNQPDACRLLVREGKVRHGLWEEMRPLDQLLAMLDDGPQWPKRWRYVSANYEITSDIDQRTCAQAGMLLEESLANLRVQFPGVKDDKSVGRFRVFLFSGQAGYLDYARRILGAAPPHTAGLYTSVLKQLLIWNLPRREEMEQTIRHEGFHQFLDRVLIEPPVWFNEGLAEYWQTARREQDRFTGGQARPEYVARLLRNRTALPRLQELAYAGSADFYAHADVRYPQAWAFVHFLRKGPPQYQKVFTALWEALRGDCSLRAALDRGFAGVDWSRLETEFWSHLERLH